jgi:hypothetical protein
MGTFKDGKCDICGVEYEIGTTFYDDLCDECAEGEGRDFE